MLPFKGSCDNLLRTPAAETFEIQTRILTRNSAVLFAENVQKSSYQLLLSPFSAISQGFHCPQSSPGLPPAPKISPPRL
jgi:hypothetical protein